MASTAETVWIPVISFVTICFMVSVNIVNLLPDNDWNLDVFNNRDVDLLFNGHFYMLDHGIRFILCDWNWVGHRYWLIVDLWLWLLLRHVEYKDRSFRASLLAFLAIAFSSLTIIASFFPIPGNHRHCQEGEQEHDFLQVQVEISITKKTRSYIIRLPSYSKEDMTMFVKLRFLLKHISFICYDNFAK